MGNKSSKGEKEETSKDFITHEVLGKGSFGQVKCVSRKQDPKKMLALKKISYGGFFTPSTKEMVAKEIIVQLKFDHPNITKMESFWYEPGTVYGGSGYILLEYCSKGSARSLAPHDYPFSTNIVPNDLYFLKQMTSALAYVHERNVIHRDIKLENILIDESRQFKLTDFGVSVGRVEGLDELRKALGSSSDTGSLTKLSPQDTIRTRTACGTLIYMAPEMLSGREYGKEVDIYALGLALREVLAGHSIVKDPTFNPGNLFWKRKCIVKPYFDAYEPFATCLHAGLCFLPAKLQGTVLKVLTLHLVATVFMTVVAMKVPLCRISDAMIATDPNSRPTAAECLMASRLHEFVFMLSVLSWLFLVILFPFDACGLSIADWLTATLLKILGILWLFVSTPWAMFGAIRMLRLTSRKQKRS